MTAFITGTLDAWLPLLVIVAIMIVVVASGTALVLQTKASTSLALEHGVASTMARADWAGRTH